MVIKHPIDLSTCKKKLKHGKYGKFEKLNRDLLQIWENCRIYNRDGSLIVQQADAMEDYHKKYLNDNPIPVNIPHKRSREENDPEEISFEMKVTLVEKIRKAPQETINKVFSIVDEKCTGAIERIKDYLRIKVDKLDIHTIESIKQ